MLLLTPTIAWSASRGRTALILISGAVGLAGITVVVSGSRGAWLALGLAIAVTAALALAKRRSRQFIQLQLRGMPRAAMVSGLVAAASAAIVTGPAIASRLIQGGGDNLRVTLNLTALRMFAADPLTGSGPGTWVVRRAAFT